MGAIRGKKGKSGTKKYHRMEVKCARYRSQKRREKNKMRRLETYMKHNPNDKQALTRYNQLYEFVYGK
jgi:hypothetical protein